MLKTVSSIVNAIGALNYKGAWDASTNTPTLASGVGVKGDYYQVSVAGSTTLDGISNWGVGDVVAFNGSTWQRIEGGADLNGVNLSYTGTLTGGTGVVNIGSGQVYKDASGNVGFGTNAPAVNGLEISRATGSATPTPVEIRLKTTTDANNWSTTSPWGQFTFYSDDASGSGPKIHAAIGVIARTTAGAGSGLTFSVDDQSGNLNERMRLEPATGNVLIGYTGSNGTFPLQVNGQIFATSSTIATSDSRYKENIVPLTGALALVASLNPVQFNWKQHSVHKFDTETPTVGFLAQEVQQVLLEEPYLKSIVKTNVTELSDGSTEEFLGIAEGNMIALLTKAIQELKAEFDLYKQTHP